jgi:hypothetical protein
MAGATREAAGLHQYLSVIDVAPIIAASGIVSNPVVSQSIGIQRLWFSVTGRYWAIPGNVWPLLTAPLCSLGYKACSHSVLTSSALSIDPIIEQVSWYTFQQRCPVQSHRYSSARFELRDGMYEQEWGWHVAAMLALSVAKIECRLK